MLDHTGIKDLWAQCSALHPQTPPLPQGCFRSFKIALWGGCPSAATEEIGLSHGLGTWSGMRLRAWTFSLMKEKNGLKTGKLAGVWRHVLSIQHAPGQHSHFPARQGCVVKASLKKHKTEPGKLRFVTVSVSWVRGPILAALSSVVFPLYRYGN